MTVTASPTTTPGQGGEAKLPAPSPKPTAQTALTPEVARIAPPKPQKAPELVYWSKNEAAAAYSRMVGPANANLKRIVAAEKVDNLKKMKQASKAQAQVEDDFMRSLSAGAWEPALLPYVENVLATASSRRSYWQGCSEATSLEEYYSLDFDDDPHPGSAQVFRVKLGLPGVNS